VARLEGLTRDQMADVLGLAYSFAGGTMQAHVEASIALPMQIGRAAQAAVQAVDMVKAGLTGPHDVLEGPFGYSALIEPLDLARYTPGAPWRMSEVSIKPFPSGRASHAVLAELSQERLQPDDIRRIVARVPPLVHRLVGRPITPEMTPAYARLCLPFLAALMVVDGRIDPRRFNAETFADPVINTLAARVYVMLDSNPDLNALSPQSVKVQLQDGAWGFTYPATLGSPDAPMSPEQYATKYALCRDLAGTCDPRLFDDSLAYATDPR
jgi:2-methylcitrate dehydratase PrpD